MIISKPFKGNYIITSPFGWRWNGFHDGVDFKCPTGTPVYAVDSGKVIRAEKDWFGGLYIDIVHDSDRRMSRYVHLLNFAVRAGDTVKIGQFIGRSGTSGNSFGPHLHFGLFDREPVRERGKAINPSILFPKWQEPDQFNQDDNMILQKILQEARNYLNGGVKPTIYQPIIEMYNRIVELSTQLDYYFAQNKEQEAYWAGKISLSQLSKSKFYANRVWAERMMKAIKK